MYKLLLILKYLRRKLAPLFAAVAVMLCTAMVIIVISVMGGFLDMLRSSAKKLTGDVVISARTLAGFPHYDALIKKLEALPEVEVATPMIRTLGLMNVYGRTVDVMIEGVRPQELDRIVSYRDTLYWSPKDMIRDLEDSLTLRDLLEDESVRNRHEQKQRELKVTDLESASVTLKPPAAWQDPDQKELPGIVIGIEVNPWHRRDDQGRYSYTNMLVRSRATITTVPLTEKGDLGAYKPTYRKFIVVNEFKSGLYEVDAKVVFVPFEVLQQMLEMDTKEVWEKADMDEDTGEPMGDLMIRPARANRVVVRGAAGFSLDEVHEAVRQQVREFGESHPEMFPPAVETWEQVHGTLLRAVANEKGLVTFLFIIISVVAIVMVATTFYMIVLEKTRDIGVLRALGASRPGIMTLFLGYGLAIGIVGSVVGFCLAFLIVTRLNEIQAWLAHGLGVTLFYVAVALVGLMLGGAIGLLGGLIRGRIRIWALSALAAGAMVALGAGFVILQWDGQLGTWLNESIRWQMWDPQTYFFDRIPGRIDQVEASAIVLGAVISSVIGSLIPALLAARLDPIEALRYE